MKLLLVRHAYGSDATLGRLHFGEHSLFTLEEPWSHDPDGPGGQKREPGKAESCVPDGEYLLHPHTGTTFKNVWCLVNVTLGVYRNAGDIPAGQKWGRSSILIHAGNTTDDILGCVVVGLRFARMGGKPAVLESRAALDQLRTALGAGQHNLEIRPTLGTKELL